MCVYIHVYVYTTIYIYICMNIHLYICMYIHMYILVCCIYRGTCYYSGNNTVATDIFLNCYAFNDFTMYIIHCYTILIIY